MKEEIAPYSHALLDIGIAPEKITEIPAKICKSCIWWEVRKHEDAYDPVLFPIDPDSCERMVMPFEVRECYNPQLRKFERPINRNQAAVCDGSKYEARLVTGPEFGCIQHKQRNDNA